jgi:hypothetical protein
MKCCICNIREANKTGTHIFPAWMVASAFDENSRTRNYEQIHTIGTFHNKLPYFGNSVLPEEINRSIGRDLSDKEIAEQKNPLTVDNLWCSECENRIRILEEYFLTNVDRQTNDFTNFNDLLVKNLSDSNNYIIRLFIYSLIIRADAANFMGFSLYYKSRKKLKSLFSTFTGDSLNSTIDIINNSDKKQLLLKLPIRLVKTEEIETTDNFVFTNKEYDRPYFLIINRYILQFYCKGSHIQFKPSSFFGISKLISNHENFRNYKENVFKIALLREKTWKEVGNNFNVFLAKEVLRYYVIMFKAMVKLKFGFTPNKYQISKYTDILINNDTNIAIKYTPEKILDAMNKSLGLQ